VETEVQYSESFYDSERLREWAKQYLDKLPKDAHALVSTGSSGAAIASAMLTLSRRKLTHIYIRKSGEDAHDMRHGGSWVKHIPKFCFVDDFISDGCTIGRVYYKCEELGYPLSYALVGHKDNRPLEVEMPPVEIIYVAPQ